MLAPWNRTMVIAPKIITMMKLAKAPRHNAVRRAMPWTSSTRSR